MKAVTVLICLALGRDITASILFRPQYQLTERLDDQQQQRQQYQPHHHQHHHHQQERKHQLQQQQQDQQDQDYVDQYQQVRVQKQDQKSSSKSSSESDESREQQTNGRQNHQNNQQNNQQKNQQYEKNWNSPYYTKVISRNDAVPYEDVLVWRQIQADPQSSQSLSTSSSDETSSQLNRKRGSRPQSNTKYIEQIFKDAIKTLKHVSEKDKKNMHQAFVANEQQSQESQRTNRNNATEMLRQNQYDADEHVVKTDDGYYLTMFRIKSKSQSSESSEQQKRPIVLLMHGLLGSADDFLLMGPGKSLAYKMADAGFDVWLGNTRGSKYSRRHASKHPAQPDFWRFSIDEIASQDLPAMIDYALNEGKQSKLYYVGHSQGSTAFFALASTSPEYREKIAVMYALSPMVYMTNTRSPLLRMISPKNRYYQALHDELGHGQFKPNKELIAKVGGDMCESQIACRHVCSNVNFVMTGVDTSGMNPEIIPVITSHLPAGASTRQIKQYGQAIAYDQFRKYDYGPTINQKVYGTPQPPKYNMTEVNVPVVLYHSEEDWMAHPKDVERLSNELPNVREKYKVPEEHFSHMDFQFAKKAPQAVNERLIESIKKDYSY